VFFHVRTGQISSSLKIIESFSEYINIAIQIVVNMEVMRRICKQSSNIGNTYTDANFLVISKKPFFSINGFNILLFCFLHAGTLAIEPQNKVSIF